MVLIDPLYLPDGKLMITDGKLVEDPDTCCCGDPCGDCENGTPARLRVTLSGVQLCTGCVGPWGAVWVKWTSQPAPILSASYILTQHGANPCVWEYTASVAGTITWYSDACITPMGWPPVYNIDTLYMYANVTAGNVLFEAYYYEAAVAWHKAWIFYGGQATATPCGGTTVITNQNAPCSAERGMANEWITGHAGGTATVVRV